MLAEVALEADRLDARVAGVQPLDDAPGSVLRAVVDDDHLEGARVRLQHLDGLADDLLDGSLLVVNGHHERDVRSIVLSQVG
jgi:hypothetical protein